MRRILFAIVWLGCKSGPSSPAPTSAFTAPDTGMVGEPLLFDGGGSQHAAHYQWDFGDGSHGGTSKLGHLYSAPGSYTVTLTVAADGGKTSTSTHDLTISAPTPGPDTPVVGVVSDPDGNPLPGVTASEGQKSATSDANGRILLMLSGARHTLLLAKDGYAAQYRPMDLSTALSGYFETTLIPREPAMPFDADKGGTLTGKDGAKVTIAGDALVDSAGNKVAGMVTIALTPVDITRGPTRGAFPGRFEGVASDATSGPLLSYGTAEYALYRGGERLQLAPGRTATIEVPAYANANLDLTPLKAGDSFPLWSLDEASGVWIQEGSGKVVASTGSPTGLSLQAEVSHFSWWNHDFNGDPSDDDLQCGCESSEDICAMFGKAAFTCHIAGAVGNGGSFDTVAQPYFSADADIVGHRALRVPSQYPVIFAGSAFGGTFRGTITTMSPAGQTTGVVIPLAPAMTVDALPDQTVTLPYTEAIATTRPFTKHRYHVQITPGGILQAVFQPELGASAGLRILDSSDTQVASALGDSQSAAISYVTTGTDYVVELFAFSMGSGQLTLRAGTLTEETLSVPYDVAVTLLAGDEHRYHSTLTSGSTYNLKWDPGSTSSMGLVRLLAPDGTELFNSDKVTTNFGHVLVADTSGSYTVSVQAFADTTGTLHLLTVGGNPPDDGGTDAGAGTDSGGGTTVTPINLPFNMTYMDVSNTMGLSFTAAAGSGLIIRCTTGVSDAGTVRVKTPSGGLLTSFAMTSDPPVSPIYHPIYLPTGGDYTIEIDPPTMNDHLFLIDIQPVTNIVSLPLRSPAPYTIAGLTGTLGYTFNANAGAEVRMIEARQCSSFNGDVLYQDLTFSEDDKVATTATSGTQLLVVRKKGGVNCGGMDDYTLTVRVAVPIAVGSQSAPFSITQNNFQSNDQSFSFTAAAGTVLSGKVTGSNFSYFSTTLFGESKSSDIFVSDFGPWVLSTSGTHVVDVTVDSASGTRTSASTIFYLYPEVSPSPVPDPRLAQHTAVSPGERKWFSFSSSDAWANPPNPTPAPTSFTLTYSSDDGSSKGRALVYIDNANPFYSGTPISNTFGGTGGNTGGVTAANGITGATTWNVQLVTDPNLTGPTTPMNVTWYITASP
jgi:PKD domain